jgi:hypothetical protein
MPEMASGKMSIKDGRRTLKERLNRFNQKAQEMIEDNVEEVPDILPPFTGWEENNEGLHEDEDKDEESSVHNEEESNGNKDDTFDWQDDENEKTENPEMTPIWMPFSFHPEDIERLNLKILATQELELHKGQASDCLQNLCLALGHKAMLYRTKLRHTKTSKGKGRACVD